MKLADLHIHTNFSDGTFTPKEVVRHALKYKIACIAIADHDSTDGIDPVMHEAKGQNLEVIPAIELSSSLSKKEIHILGYFLNWKEKWLQKRLDELKKLRIKRIYEMIKKLKNNGVTINPEEVFKLAHNSSVGRLHLARAMVKQGVVDTISDAFRKYIADTSPAYVSKFRISTVEAVNLIIKAGGIPVLAHPHTLESEVILPFLISKGLKGLEVYYPEYTRRISQHYLNLAKKYDLLVTGGSDCHGLTKNQLFMGKVVISYKLVEKLKESLSAN